MRKYKIVAYNQGIPAKNKNPEKPLILSNFISGVTKLGDTGINYFGKDTLTCDVAVLQGFVHAASKNSPHLNLRKEVLKTQQRNNNKTLIVDSNLFLYSNPNNTKQYLRYSFDGVFPTTGFYFDSVIDPLRWKKISANLNISLKEWRTTGNYILICLQRNGGWSMGTTSSINWAIDIISKIRKYTDREIVIRAHPGDVQTIHNIPLAHKNVRLSTNVDIIDDFKNCWCSVTYNSSPGVASIIEGIPTFVTDPVPQNSQAFLVSNIDLSQIENPLLPNRQQWVEKLAMSHWNFTELANGEAWNHMRSFI